ncbi:TetR/AcrR family transcriptional regulator [Siculibacillus lacustris]|uniref:TetR/AcrR family transcriptional regulator n=2 Tax=Siculibacillus lacustris TaxID=1549641 RepID=A0A4Q9VM89_9HYPH|nr:TetR/AcrR family transcriptional regulator [Siculibacillus lacustris]
MPGHNDEKARQILDGARAVFLRDGFDGASMNDIAKVAGVSKGTLYVYFQSKDALFEALVRHDKRQQAEQMCRWQSEGGDIRTVLTRVGRSLLTMMAQPDHIAQVRTVMAVAPKFPQIGRAFYEAGPVFGLRRLSAYLDRQVAEGRLEIADSRKAALVFIQICQSDIHKRLMFCVEEAADPAEIDEAVADAVDIFLKVYGKP